MTLFKLSSEYPKKDNQNQKTKKQNSTIYSFPLSVEIATQVIDKTTCYKLAKDISGNTFGSQLNAN